jgi:ribonucleotide reductase beta subunit family protein with ferritin-like domain
MLAIKPLKVVDEERSKYSMFPVEAPTLWEFYKKQSHAFWIPEEIDLADDLKDFHRLNKGEQHFVKHVLAFFNQADGVINENLALRFYQDVDLPEARAFYAMQLAIEAVHSEMYSLLIDTYVKDTHEKNQLFNAIATIPAIGKKADWALKWMASSASFAERLFAFAVVEGLYFSGSFCAIYWLKSRGIMPGLCKSNEWISRDEGLHWTFAAELYRYLGFQASTSRLREIIKEAVAIEQEFVCSSLPVDLLGMNKTLMSTYIEYTADRILCRFGIPKLYGSANPFDFMKLIDLENKTNFFEGRVSEYSKGHDTTISFDAIF